MQGAIYRPYSELFGSGAINISPGRPGLPSNAEPPAPGDAAFIDDRGYEVPIADIVTIQTDAYRKAVEAQ